MKPDEGLLPRWILFRGSYSFRVLVQDSLDSPSSSTAVQVVTAFKDVVGYFENNDFLC